MVEENLSVKALRRQARETFRSGDNKATRSLADDALASARAMADRAFESEALNWLARASLRDADFDAVATLCARSRDAAQAVGDPEALRWPFHLEAEAARMAGDDERAMPLYERSLALHRQIGDRRMQAVELLNMSFVAAHLGKYADAVDMLQESLRSSLELDAGLGPTCLMGLGAALASSGHAERGTRLLGASEAACEAADEVFDPADQPEFDRGLNTARGILGPARFRELFDDGRALSAQDAIALALRRE